MEETNVSTEKPDSKYELINCRVLTVKNNSESDEEVSLFDYDHWLTGDNGGNKECIEIRIGISGVTYEKMVGSHKGRPYYCGQLCFIFGTGSVAANDTEIIDDFKMFYTHKPKDIVKKESELAILKPTEQEKFYRVENIGIINHNSKFRFILPAKKSIKLYFYELSLKRQYQNSVKWDFDKEIEIANHKEIRMFGYKMYIPLPEFGSSSIEKIEEDKVGLRIKLNDMDFDVPTDLVRMSYINGDHRKKPGKLPDGSWGDIDKTPEELGGLRPDKQITADEFIQEFNKQKELVFKDK